MISIRPMLPADLPFADSLRAIAGWNQTPADWRRLLALEPAGCFLAEKNGSPAGVATTTSYDEKVAWIGMVLVHPAARGSGIGTALLTHCLESLRNRGIPCIKLDATPAGQPIYEKLGFRAEWEINRWEGTAQEEKLPAAPGVPVDSDPAGRPSAPGLALIREPLHSLDTQAFGVSRRRLVEGILAEASILAWLPSGSDSSLRAYGLLRGGTRALYLGPAVSRDSTASVHLAAALLRAAAGRPLFWDLPVAQKEVSDFINSLGFRQQRPLLRMCLGPNLAPGDPRLQLALADPAVG